MDRPALTIACGLLWGLAMFINDAHAQHSQQYTETQNQFLTKYIQAKKCMRTTGTAARWRGGSAEHVQYMMFSVCATPLYVFMQGTFPEQQSLYNVIRITRTSYYEDVLGVEEPPLPPELRDYHSFRNLNQK